MKHLTTILDKVANELEARGLRKLATEVDVVANTLENHIKEVVPDSARSAAYQISEARVHSRMLIRNSPEIIKLFTPYLKEIDANIAQGEPTPPSNASVEHNASDTLHIAAIISKTGIHFIATIYSASRGYDYRGQTGTLTHSYAEINSRIILAIASVDLSPTGQIFNNNWTEYDPKPFRRFIEQELNKVALYKELYKQMESYTEESFNRMYDLLPPGTEIPTGAETSQPLKKHSPIRW